MTTYIMLAKWTEQGALKVKDSPARLDAAKKALGAMGGEFKSVFMTMGRYDLIAVDEAPDDSVAARFTLQLGMLGNVQQDRSKSTPSRYLSQSISLCLRPWSRASWLPIR